MPCIAPMSNICAPDRARIKVADAINAPSPLYNLSMDENGLTPHSDVT